jgi:TPR repeat protein
MLALRKHYTENTAAIVFLLMLFAGCGPTDKDEQFLLAKKYSIGDGVSPDSEKALKWYRAAAVQGHAEAQITLSEIYHDGVGVTKSKSESLKWLEAAVAQGDARAQVLLGLKHEIGEDVPRNYQEAVRLYQMAAESGFSLGQLHLADMYNEGLGVEEDNGKAIELYSAALEQGLEEARELLGEVQLEIQVEIGEYEILNAVKQRLAENVEKINEKYRVLKEPVYGQVREEITCVGMTLYVYQVVPYSSQNVYDMPESGYYRIAAEIGIQNLAPSNPLQVNPAAFKVLDEAGNSWSRGGIQPEPRLDSIDLRTGEIVRGWVSFDVPTTFRRGYLVMTLSLAGAPIYVSIP